MRYLLLPILLIALVACQTKQSEERNLENSTANQEAITFDSLKAAKYGADQYGMKAYVIAFLKKGPNRPTDSIHATELQRAHLDNIGKLAEEGKLVLAGPFFGNDSLRGIYVFNVSTIEEAKLLTETDPAIQYGSLKMELKQWYGSAALMEVNQIHESIAKINI